MEKTIEFENPADIQTIFGKYDKNLQLIEEKLSIQVVRNNDGVLVSGEEKQVEKAAQFFDYLKSLVRNEISIKTRDIIYVLRMVEHEDQLDVNKLKKGQIDVSVQGSLVTPKTQGQFNYIEAIKKNDIVFGVGPAGTGKTYLAMAMAVNAYKKNLVRRIILTRPAIEAGENLGFLPGDLSEKVYPYLRPLYDALYDMMEADKVEELTEQGIIEVAPLAFMRGRTLNDAFVILDEAQNSTPYQMKMFLTRLGFDSKTVITGDPTQSDLPKGTANGLTDAEKVLDSIEGINFVHLTNDDVVRHELVQKIIQAYENDYSRE